MTPGVVIGVTWRVSQAIVNAWLEPDDIAARLLGLDGSKQTITNNKRLTVKTYSSITVATRTNS
jgi:hypothetical protein